MWYIQRYRPSNGYILLFLTLLSLTILITFYDKKINELKPIYDKQQILEIKRPVENRTIILPSTDYLRVKLDLTKNTAICQSNDYLILYILSKLTNIERRKVIRSTWASPLNGTCFVFIIGKIRNYDTINSTIQNEKEQYKDIVQIDHLESYANVIYKETGALQWSAHFYPTIPYLFKTDDDLILDPLIITEVVDVLVKKSLQNSSYISKYRPVLNQQLLAEDEKTFFRGGWSMDYQPAMRQSKFAVSESVWPHPVLPLYCSGFGWLMSKSIRDKLVQAASIYPTNKIVWIGDVFLSGFIAKAANVKCLGVSIDYEQTSSANCSCLFAQRAMLTVCSSTFHGGDENDQTKFKEYEKAWKVIQERHKLIDMNMKMMDIC